MKIVKFFFLNKATVNDGELINNTDIELVLMEWIKVDMIIASGRGLWAGG